jgi:hypothetical protein
MHSHVPTRRLQSTGGYSTRGVEFHDDLPCESNRSNCIQFCDYGRGKRLLQTGIRRSQLHYANLSNHTVSSSCRIRRSLARCTLLLRKVNFLDAFKEVAYLLEDLPSSFFVFVRTCFLLHCVPTSDKSEFAFKLTNSLRIVLVEWNVWGFFRSKL